MNRIVRKSAALALLLGFHSACADEVVEERLQSEDVNFRVVQVLGDLDHPWSLAFLPDGGLLVTERAGRLQRFDKGTLREVTGLPDITAEGQGGLLDVVLHPEFQTNQFIYFSYSAPHDGGVGTTVARARLEGTRLEAVEPLFRMNPPGSSGRHFAGRLIFDDEQYLYISIGDRGDQNRAQELSCGARAQRLWTFSR